MVDNGTWVSGLSGLFSSTLQHLWPDFSLLIQGSSDPRALTVVALCIMGLIVVITLVYASYKTWLASKNIRTIKRLLKGLDQPDLVEKRRDLRNTFLKQKSLSIRHVWREFDESLVGSPDQKRLYNTLDSEHFFNTHSLARGLTENRLLAAVPSFLIAIGVLGTFIGLTMGLSGLELNQQAGVDELRDGIHAMINGAAVAFGTSVWGVFLSLVVNFIEKLLESRVKRNIAELQDRIDYLFPRLTAEYSLSEIADNGRQSKEALQILHEKIGEKLQEQLEAAGSRFQEGIATSLRDILQPEITKMSDNASQQSTRALEDLVHKFMDGMGESGKQQKEMLDMASNNVQEAVAHMGERMGGFMELLSEQQAEIKRLTQEQLTNSETSLNKLQTTAQEQQQTMAASMQTLLERLESQSSNLMQSAEEREVERQQRLDEHLSKVKTHQNDIMSSLTSAVDTQKTQSEEMANQHATLLQELNKATDGISRSSQHLETSASELGKLGTQLTDATGILGQKLVHTTEQIATVTNQARQLQRLLEDQGGELNRLQQSLQEGTERFSHAADSANSGFQALQSHQQAFLEQLSHDVSQLGTSLKNNIMDVEKQAEEWLTQYSDAVSHQTERRMQEWNNHTREYTDMMQRAISALTDTIDEIEVKVNATA